MLKINLIEQVAKQQEVLTTKNKVSSDFVQKTLYYSEEFTVTKAVATNTGNINASDMMGTQTVFPSDKAGADGEYLIYLMPRFVRGRSVYRLFNTESSKQINNTVKISNSSLGNYVYQVDTTSTPDQAKEEGETVEVENTERSVERNRSNKIKPLQEGETPEQYQERFMKEYQDLVRDINGALSDIDPEQVLKQWQQKQKELEEKQIEQQAVETFTMMDEGCQQMVDAINTYAQNNCSLKQETSKSIFFETSITKSGLDVCQKTLNELVVFLTEMGSVFSNLNIATTNPFSDSDPSFVKNFAEKLLNDPSTKDRVEEILDALRILNGKKSKDTKSEHKIALAYLLFNDILKIPTEGSSESIKNLPDKIVKWAQEIQQKITEFQIESLVNELQLQRDNIPYTENLSYVEQMIDLAKVMVQTAEIDLIVRVMRMTGRKSQSARTALANEYNLPVDQYALNALLQEKLKTLQDPQRPVESFFGKFSLSLLKVQLGKYLTKEELAALTITHQIGSSITPEEQEELDIAAKNEFKNLKPEQIEKYAEWMQRQIPTWLLEASGENTTQEILLRMYSLCSEGKGFSETEIFVADLPAFSRGKAQSTVQYAIPEIVELHAHLGAYKEDQFEQFVESYVINLGKKLGLDCNQESSTYSKNSCNRLNAHVHFILGRNRTSGPGSNNDKGETFEEILMLDQLFRMLPDLSKNPENVRFGNKTGTDAVLDYLRCTSSESRHYLSDSSASSIDKSEQITIIDEKDDGQETTTSITVDTFADSLVTEVKDKTLRAIEKEAARIKLESAGYLTDISSGTVNPVYRDDSGQLQESNKPINVYIDTKAYSDQFIVDANTILAKHTNKDPKTNSKLRKELEDLAFKYLTLGLAKQKNDDSIPTVLSGLTNLLEKAIKNDSASADLSAIIGPIFSGRMVHIPRYLNKYTGIIFTAEEELTTDDIKELLAIDTLQTPRLIRAVAGKLSVNKMLETTMPGSDKTLGDWLTAFSEKEAKKLKVSGLNVDVYAEYFKSSVTIRIQKLLESGEILTKESLLEIMSQARLEGAKAVIAYMNPNTPVDALYTLETQEDYLKSLNDRTFPRPKRKRFISPKRKSGYKRGTVSGADKAKEEQKKIGAAIAEKAQEESIGGTAIRIGGELVGKVRKVQTGTSLRSQIDEIWGQGTIAGGTQPAKILRGLLETENVVKVRNPDGTETYLPNTEELDILLRKASGGAITFPLNAANPIQITAKQLMDKDGKPVTTTTNGSKQDPNDPSKTLKTNQEVKIPLHVLEITFTLDNRTYTIQVNQASPPAFKFDPKNEPDPTKTSSIITLNNLVLKSVQFEWNATTPQSVLGEDCPATAVVSDQKTGAKKLNPLAMLTIEDNEGITFFNISKLKGIPGGSSGFADLAHFKIKGLTRKGKGTEGSFTQRKKQNEKGEETEELESIDLAMTVVEGKVGDIPASLRSFGRIEAIQSGIVESILSGNKQSLKSIRSARYDVFVGRCDSGSISYSRAQNNRIADQLGRIAIRKPQTPAQAQQGQQVTTSINSNTLQKILKSIWV